jgi:hypothetical protein
MREDILDPDDAEPSDEEGAADAATGMPRSRRALLLGAAAAGAALVTQVATAPLPAGAANGSTVKVGQTNSGTDPTSIRNTRHSASARALVGTTTWTGAAAQSAGVTGESKGQDGIGVFGKAHNGTSARAVLGISTTGTGVQGQGPTGVYGRSSASIGIGAFGEGYYGVYALSTVNGGYGLLARATGALLTSTAVSAQGVYAGVLASGNSIGVQGSSTGGHAIRGESSGTGYAGFFTHRVRVLGDLSITGTLSKAGGTFRIDHPLEPERRYLVHGFVEAPEQLNVYRGTVKLNARGRATVRLPRYFDAANTDPSYQLTPVGAPAPDLHISKAVSGNRFGISGGSAGLTVCWQVTAARDDAWARKHPVRVEQLKRKADRGKYLHPREMGKARSAGIDFADSKPRARPKALRGLPKDG